MLLGLVVYIAHDMLNCLDRCLWKKSLFGYICFTRPHTQRQHVVNTISLMVVQCQQMGFWVVARTRLVDTLIVVF